MQEKKSQFFCLSNLKDVVGIDWEEKDCRFPYLFLACSGKAWFCFRLIMFELALRYSDGDVKWAGGYLSENLREEFQTEDINLAFASIQL